MKVLKYLGIAFLVLLGLAVILPLTGLVKLNVNATPMGWETEAVDRGEMRITVTASGAVEPLSTVKVGSQVSGKVKEVLVEPDDAVSDGEVLARLDTELLEADRRDRELLLDRAQSALALLTVERQNLDLREARLRVQQARQRLAIERSSALLELASKNLVRFEDMRAVDAASLTDVEIRQLEKENAERDRKLAALELETLEVDLKQVTADRAALAARLVQAESEVAQARQALAKAVTNLGYASITAPCAGVVLDRVVERGQTIAANFQTPELFTIVSELNRVRVLVKLDEAEMGRIAPGQKVRFEVDAFRGQEFSGEVKAVRLKHELRANLVTYPIVIEAENPPAAGHPHGKLRPGMTAYVTFEIEVKADVLRVPAAALRFVPPATAILAQETPAGESEAAPEAQKTEAEASSKSEPAKPDEAPRGLPATVHRKLPDGSLQAVPIRVGDNDAEYYELLDGEVKAGDELVTGQAMGDAGGGASKSKRRRKL
ncbi:MAG: efflux RND transporter periplasmic adaptor subunit [Planctomycetes bacterium]|nr:efflux RND transporter periplasmic adaptor subunit [Planctomycetota bacterium]